MVLQDFLPLRSLVFVLPISPISPPNCSTYLISDPRIVGGTNFPGFPWKMFVVKFVNLLLYRGREFVWILDFTYQVTPSVLSELIHKFSGRLLVYLSGLIMYPRTFMCMG